MVFGRVLVSVAVYGQLTLRTDGGQFFAHARRVADQRVEILDLGLAHDLPTKLADETIVMEGLIIEGDYFVHDHCVASHAAVLCHADKTIVTHRLTVFFEKFIF